MFSTNVDMSVSEQGFSRHNIKREPHGTSDTGFRLYIVKELPSRDGGFDIIGFVACIVNRFMNKTSNGSDSSSNRAF